jgi:hypothetical protein
MVSTGHDVVCMLPATWIRRLILECVECSMKGCRHGAAGVCVNARVYANVL